MDRTILSKATQPQPHTKHHGEDMQDLDHQSSTASHPGNQGGRDNGRRTPWASATHMFRAMWAELQPLQENLEERLQELAWIVSRWPSEPMVSLELHK